MSYEIKLPLFEGPFDLLLFFIERDELDIYDIPISQITKDFLDYIRHLETMNMEVASEFILVAATLMRIKAKMLLPRPVLDEEGKEIDPREELVKHLLEYKKYKSVLSELAKFEEDRSQLESRGNITRELKSLSENANVEWELLNLDLYKLLKVFQRVMERYEYELNRPSHKVIQWPYTLEQQKKYILQKVGKESRVSFSQIIEDNPTKIAVIFNFLSILDLLQLKLITMHIGIGFNNFWIESFEAVRSN
ncbi:MAG TPA: segregation/condensation protein A [Cyclobacteriaceae bacterium]